MKKPIVTSLIIAAFMLAAAVLLRAAQSSNLIGSEAVTRAIEAMAGLVLAAYGNFIPKEAHSRATVCKKSWAQSASRVGGWSFTLAGLAYTALSLFAPIGIGSTVALAVVATAMMVTAGYAGWVVLSCRRG